MFHICAADGEGGLAKYSFLCPNGTVFNQEYFICDWWFNFDCSQAEALYARNDEIRAEQEANIGAVGGNGNGGGNGAFNGNGNGGSLPVYVDNGGDLAGDLPPLPDYEDAPVKNPPFCHPWCSAFFLHHPHMDPFGVGDGTLDALATLGGVGRSMGSKLGLPRAKSI